MDDEFFYDDRPEMDTHIRRTGIDTEAIRNSRAYRTARAEFRREEKVRQAPCIICGGFIDFRLRWPHADSWTLEHLKPVATHPELMLDRRNWASGHAGCNRLKGGGLNPILPGEMGEPSEAW
ncbi:hypothetical protein ACJH6J_30395 [Mycobacterium sp. SMC-18]|uniref:hypothetical protein n=1 Tax=Mycobacteriaceae TaxID=1762 RepID=UPI001BB3554F|nr:MULTISPECIES: hypothetical protein [unclassified Mycolicibacterium]BCI83577.1 hypothetical protein MTY66_52020 [Mycolicibacterium sp. TY66]BCJ78781.1 hypothetical protein MTY81_01540 [Mycolicibacterium sp. TY81]